MWDTTGDFRILMAEKAARYLENTLINAKLPGQWERRGSLQALKRVSSSLQAAKYSYIPPEELAREEMMKTIRSGALEIVNYLGGEGWAGRFLDATPGYERKRVEEHIARIRFSLNILYNLPSRLALGETKDPAYAVDIRAGRVTSATHHPEDKKLTICKVSLGRAITVITNYKDVETGTIYAVSLLPPRRFRGILSEGMFLGGDGGLLKVHEDEGKLLSDIDSSSLKEVRREVLNFLKEV